MLPLLLALPWLLLLLGFVAVVRLPRELPTGQAEGGRLPGSTPLVSVVIPARNEAHNIVRVLESVAASRYPDFELIVVDDQSTDGTGELARRVPAGRARRVQVVEGEALPEGWLGKPWSCAQGARIAAGDLLLFTDADTVHSPHLLARAVAGLEEDRADALTLMGRQIMETFWERLIQPSMFLMMVTRFRDAREPLPPRRWRDAIANGQYLMFRRNVYDALGGHEAVRGEVVEDLRLAQILIQSGARLSLRSAERAFATRMYRDLGELVRGWSKNLALADKGAWNHLP
jgi:chlorobactene glucosyltransferase